MIYFFNLSAKKIKTTISFLATIFSVVFLFYHTGFAEEPLKVTADRLEMLNETDMVMGKGNVDVNHENMHLKADRIKMNSKTGKGVASGNVLMEDESSKITGDKLYFDVNSKKGEIFNAKGDLASEYFFTGKRVKKEGEDRYKVYDGTITTCFGDKPTWLFKCDYADLVVEDYAYLKNASLWVNGVPFFYVPYGVIPLRTKRATGFLFPSIGSSNKDGFFINNSFFWAINDQMDSTVYLDYLADKGVRPSLEFRYAPSKKTAGQWSGTYLKEKDTHREFWKLQIDHKQEFDYGIMATAKLDLLGDNNYDKEYGDLAGDRTRRLTDSYLNLLKNGESKSLEILGRYRESVEYGRDEKYSLLPQVIFRNQREKIQKTPLYFSLESSYIGFDREIGTLDNNVERFDFYPQFSLPFTTLPWMTFTPTIGARETYYSNGYDLSGKKTSGFSRELYDITASFEGPKFSKIFRYNNPAVPKVKHLIEPRVNYRYVPDMDDGDRYKITVFDQIDTIGPLNIVQYSLTNRFLKKMRMEDNSYTTEDAIRFEVSQTYDFREASRTINTGIERRPFSDVRWDLDSHIWTPLHLNFDGTYDLYDELLKTANIDMGLDTGGFWSLYFERRYIKDESTFIQGTLGLNLNKNWSTKYNARYDELNKEFQENGFGVNYSAQCWDFAFDFVNRNNFVSGNKETENKFFFLITLKGIGSVGKKRDTKMLHRNY